jgi:hypothetical protein
MAPQPGTSHPKLFYWYFPCPTPKHQIVTPNGEWWNRVNIQITKHLRTKTYKTLYIFPVPWHLKVFCSPPLGASKTTKISQVDEGMSKLSCLKVKGVICRNKTLQTISLHFLVLAPYRFYFFCSWKELCSF